MNQQHLIIACLIFLLSPLPAMADKVQSTTASYASLRHCVAGETACDGIGRSHVKEIGGTPGGSEAHASVEDPEFGAAQASSVLTGEPGAVELKTSVKTIAGTRNGGTTWMLQRYTNASDASQTLTFNGTLEFEQTVPAENAEFPADKGGQSGTNTEMEIFSADLDSLPVGTSAEENWGLFDAGMPEGYQVLASANSEGMKLLTSGQDSETFSTSTVVQPGDSVWLFALLQSIGANGAVVDASLDTRLAIEAD